jgi:hypothetical protein
MNAAAPSLCRWSRLEHNCPLGTAVVPCCPLLHAPDMPQGRPLQTAAWGTAGTWAGRDERGSSPPARLVRNYAFCVIYLLFRRGYDPVVVSRTKVVPMMRFTVVVAGVAGLLLSFPSSRWATARRESAARPASPPPASTAARTPPATGSSFDLDLVSSGSYRGLLPLCAARQGSDDAA